jgi:hypothetical protein
MGQITIDVHASSPYIMRCCSHNLIMLGYRRPSHLDATCLTPLAAAAFSHHVPHPTPLARLLLAPAHRAPHLHRSLLAPLSLSPVVHTTLPRSSLRCAPHHPLPPVAHTARSAKPRPMLLMLMLVLAVLACCWC